jgi:formylglycine-generating enzyme required for sulfatase activity
VPLPSGPPTKRRADVAASTFVPALAQISDQGATVRRIAGWNSFDEEQQELLIRFDQWRLVVRKGEAEGGTVEVAHEALFREWTRLKGWLEPERARLEALRSLQVDGLTWDRNGRDAAFLNHRDKRLADATTLAGIEGYTKRLGALEFDYLAACQVAERSARRRTRRTRVLVYVLLVGIIAGLVLWINQRYVNEQANWYMTMRPYRVANFDNYVIKPDAERALKPNDAFRECANDCPEMIVVPAGDFMMGSLPTENGHNPDEEPRHAVTIAKRIAVSRFAVTFADWDACVSVGGCPQEDRASDDGWGRGTRPIIYVSWYDAQAYVAWLSRMTGKTYRLLSEAEWEYAARAHSTTAYFWGEEIGKNQANCKGCGSQWDNRQTSPVGSFKPNNFGLYDMAGNVWQWVQDCYHENYDGAPEDGSAWISGGCGARVGRGGSLVYEPQDLRSASRLRLTPDHRDNDLGFRVGRTLSPP